MSSVEPFDAFLARTAAAKPEDFATELQLAADQHGLSPDAAAAEFKRMRDHVVRYYEGVHPVRSFLTAAGEAVDCVPFEQQPAAQAAQAAGYSVASFTPQPSAHAGVAVRPSDPTPIPHESMCPEGSVPLLRLTLERLVSFGSLDNFFRKAPIGPTHH